MTADDHLFEDIKWCCLRCNPGCLYRSTDKGLFLLYMPTRYFQFVRCLSVCFAHCSVCVSVQLEIHSPANMNKMTDVRKHTCTAFYFIFKLLPLLYMIEKYACCHYIRHMGVVRSISRPIHGITRPRASN